MSSVLAGVGHEEIEELRELMPEPSRVKRNNLTVKRKIKQQQIFFFPLRRLKSQKYTRRTNDTYHFKKILVQLNDVQFWAWECEEDGLIYL